MTWLWAGLATSFLWHDEFLGLVLGMLLLARESIKKKCQILRCGAVLFSILDLIMWSIFSKHTNLKLEVQDDAINCYCDRGRFMLLFNISFVITLWVQEVRFESCQSCEVQSGVYVHVLPNCWLTGLPWKLKLVDWQLEKYDDLLLNKLDNFLESVQL